MRWSSRGEKISDVKGSLATLRTVRELAAQTGVSLLPVGASLFLGLVASLFDGLALALLIPLLGKIIGAQPPGSSSDHLVLTFSKFSFPAIIAVIFFAASLKIGCAYASWVTFLHWCRDLTLGLRTALFQRLLHLGYAEFARKSPAEAQDLVSQQIEKLVEQLLKLHGLALCSTTLAIYFGLMARISAVLTAAVLSFFFIVLKVLSPLISSIRDRSQRWLEERAALNEKVYQSFCRIPLLRLYGAEHIEQRDFKALASRIGQMEMGVAKRQGLLESLHDAVLLVLITPVVIFSILSSSGITNSGAAVLFVYLYLLKRSQVGVSSINRARGILAETQATLSLIIPALSYTPIAIGKGEFSSIRSALRFRDIWFSYGSTPILRGINAEIRAGSCVGLTGKSGSGKTTLISLALRFFSPDKGVVEVDGLPIESFESHSFYRHIGYVGSDPFLFGDTLRNNLIYGLRRSCPEQEIRSVLAQVGLESLLSRVSSGLDTVIGDRGALLSAGEKQRLSIARLLLKEPILVFLDEPTSNLDARTAEEITSVILRFIKGRTTVMISHSPALLAHADQLFTLEAGNLIEGPVAIHCASGAVS